MDSVSPSMPHRANAGKYSSPLRTLDGEFCLDMLDEALGQGRPEVFNTDQGVQFTAAAWTGRLLAAGVKVSMDGKGRCLDNVFVERLW